MAGEVARQLAAKDAQAAALTYLRGIQQGMEDRDDDENAPNVMAFNAIHEATRED